MIAANSAAVLEVADVAGEGVCPGVVELVKPRLDPVTHPPITPLPSDATDQSVTHTEMEHAMNQLAPSPLPPSSWAQRSISPPKRSQPRRGNRLATATPPTGSATSDPQRPVCSKAASSTRRCTPSWNLRIHRSGPPLRDRHGAVIADDQRAVPLHRSDGGRDHDRLHPCRNLPRFPAGAAERHASPALHRSNAGDRRRERACPRPGYPLAKVSRDAADRPRQHRRRSIRPGFRSRSLCHLRCWPALGCDRTRLVYTIVIWQLAVAAALLRSRGNSRAPRDAATGASTSTASTSN